MHRQTGIAEMTDAVEKTQGDGAKKGLSPYDLNANDNPGNVITQVQLWRKL